MDCGEQCVMMAGITMMPELCADNWGTVTTWVGVSQLFLGKKVAIGDHVAGSRLIFIM